MHWYNHSNPSLDCGMGNDFFNTLPRTPTKQAIMFFLCDIHANDKRVIRHLINLLVLGRIHVQSSLVFKLGVNFPIDTPNHTKRAFFIQVPEKTSNRNAPYSFNVDFNNNTLMIEPQFPDRSCLMVSIRFKS